MENIEFQRFVRELYSARKYRPVGVSVIHDYKGKFLLLQSSKDSKSWLFPQGGIEPGETLRENIRRELREETGIFFENEIRDPQWAYLIETLDAESTRVDRRGFTKGKTYFYTLARYIGNHIISIQEEEVSDARFVEPATAIELFNLGRPEKARISINALRKALELMVLPNL